MSTAQGIRGRDVLFLLAAAAGMLGDLVSKQLVFHACESQRFVDVVPFVFGIQCSRNSGALFGVGQRMGPLFVGLSIVAIILIPLMHRRFVRTADLWQAFGLGAIEAGALGNLYDRLVYGSVRDFLVLHWGPHAWPTFNVADALICAGLAALFISTCRKPHRDGPPTAAQGPS